MTASAANRKGHASARDGAGAQPRMFRLLLLGPFQLIGKTGAVDLGNKKLCALVAFLASNGPTTREKLMSLLWGTHFDAQARQNLRKALSRVRQVLSEQGLGEDVVVADDVTVALRADMIVCDAQVFERLAAESSRNSLRQAVDLYRDAFLADVLISDEAWAEWLRTQRGRLEGLLVGALIRLAEIELQQNNPEQALELASKAIVIDNLREDAHRLAIRALAATGRKAEALRRYDQLAALLKAELSTEPDARTRALVDEIRRPAAIVVEQPVADAKTSDLPSIAVLPFRSIGGDKDADYFGDGMVEDIVVSLGSLHELFVISRGSTLAFRGKDPDPREIGRTLGVRYVVGGSVQRSGKRLRVFVELCDAETGTALWTDRTEAPLDDLFDIQDSYTASFASRIAPHIRNAELRRALRKRPETMTAYDYVLRGLEHVHRDSTFDQAGACFQKAIDREPTFALPYAWSGWWRSILIRQGWSKEPVKDWTRAAQMSAKAIDLDGSNALALASYGHLKSVMERDYDGAELFLESAVQACPNGPIGWVLGSFTQSYQGRGDEAIRRAGQALKLSPLDRGRFYCHLAMGLGHYVAGRYGEAVKWGKLSAAENPGFTSTLRYLAAAHTAAGEDDEAKRFAAEVLKREPNFSLRNYLIPFRDKALTEQHRARLRQAGLPE